MPQSPLSSTHPPKKTGWEKGWKETSKQERKKRKKKAFKEPKQEIHNTASERLDWAGLLIETLRKIETQTGWPNPRNLTSVLYRLMSTSSPLLRWENFTMGTLAVVMGRMFLSPVRELDGRKHNLWGGVSR